MMVMSNRVDKIEEDSLEAGLNHKDVMMLCNVDHVTTFDVCCI